MALGLNETISQLPILSTLGKLGLLLQAAGILILLTMVFQVYAFYANRKRLQEIDTIKKDMRRIEGKIDKILGKKR